MLDPELLGPGDFIQARAALIREVGPIEAIVLARIHFRASEEYRHAYERDGAWWWRAPRSVIAEETGLSDRQVQRALTVLRDGGYVLAEHHQIDGRYDRALSFRVNLAPSLTHTGQSDGPARVNEDGPKRVNDPIKTQEDLQEEEPTFKAAPENRRGLASEAQRAWLVDLDALATRDGRWPLELAEDLSNADAHAMIQEALAFLGRGANYTGPLPGDPGWDLLSPAGQDAARRRLIPRKGA